MKRFLTILISYTLCNQFAFAGLITHQDYNAGDTITAAKQNTNENAIFNEFNGNISAANLAAGAVTSSKLDSTLTSTFTYISSTQGYRRPVLQWVSVSSITVENNTGTANETCILFPDEKRCVTENVASTNVNRQLLIGATASNSGTKDSGVYSGNTLTNNSWLAIYAWKVSDNSTDFVLVATTATPSQSNYSLLNTQFGVNAWVYLGLIRYGDQCATNPNKILSFGQVGAMTLFANTIPGADTSVGTTAYGFRVANQASASASAWSFATGSIGAVVPSNLGILKYRAVSANSLNFVTGVVDTQIDYLNIGGGGTIAGSISIWLPSGFSPKVTTAATTASEIFVTGYMDTALGSGLNNQL